MIRLNIVKPLPMAFPARLVLKGGWPAGCAPAPSPAGGPQVPEGACISDPGAPCPPHQTLSQGQWPLPALPATASHRISRVAVVTNQGGFGQGHLGMRVRNPERCFHKGSERPTCAGPRECWCKPHSRLHIRGVAGCAGGCAWPWLQVPVRVPADTCGPREALP